MQSIAVVKNRGPAFLYGMVGSTSWPSSPIEQRTVLGRSVWIKRDDLLHRDGISGNKVRKFWKLAKRLQTDAHGTGRITTIISSGGAQSNSMLALAALSALRNVRFVYVTRRIPHWLRRNPIGNLEMALALGMELVEVKDSGEVPSALAKVAADAKCAIEVPMGGACEDAEEGIHLLAQELERDFSWCDSSPIDIFVACGTGAMAHFLAAHLSPRFRVVALPVVGDKPYLEKQLKTLPRRGGRVQIVDAEAKPFGVPRHELWTMYLHLEVAGLQPDLLYGPRAWEILRDHKETWLDPSRVPVYYHCGGSSGNKSQRLRYRRELGLG